MAPSAVSRRRREWLLKRETDRRLFVGLSHLSLAPSLFLSFFWLASGPTSHGAHKTRAFLAVVPEERTGKPFYVHGVGHGGQPGCFFALTGLADTPGYGMFQYAYVQVDTFT